MDTDGGGAPQKETMSSNSGLIFVVSSPSGAGKTTLCRRLQAQFPELMFSVSYTTRAPRMVEAHGVDYYFVDDPTFDQLIQQKAFAEWAHVHGKRYGTTTQSVRQAIETGRPVLFDLDYQGARSLLTQFPKESRLVYIVPPSMAVLEERLRLRATDAPERIQQRLQKAREELTHYPMYHYVVLNDEIDHALQRLSAIYQFERAQQRGDEISSVIREQATACSLQANEALLQNLLQ